MTTAINPVDNFSWQRLEALIRFYYPSLRTPLIIYPCVGAVIGAANLLLMQWTIGIALTSLTSLLLSMMFYLFPLFFARHPSPVIETMLPVKASEKTLFFAVACLIINPIILYVPYHLVQWILQHTLTLDLQVNLDDLTLSQMNSALRLTYGLNLFANLAPLVTCMYVVLTRWKNRIGMGIGMAIVTLIVLTVLGVLVGLYLAFSGTLDFLRDKAPESYQAGLDIGRSLAETMLPYTIIIGSLGLVYTVTMVFLMYRKFKTIEV